MIVLWHCCCGVEMADAHAAFLHRDGTSLHHVTPMLFQLESDLPIPAGKLLYFLGQEVARA